MVSWKFTSILNSHIRIWLFSILFSLSCFFVSANNDSISKAPLKWNFAIGFDLTGWYMNFEGQPSEYFMSYGFFPKVGFFLNESVEFGAVMENRFQRTNLENENNEVGVGAGYYFRYHFTKLDPIRYVFKRSTLVTTLHLEWEHIFSNYRFMDVNERYPDLEPFNMTSGNRSVYHHFMPKIGLRIKVFKEIFFDFQVFYRQVNAHAVDVPVRWRAGIEYSF